MNIAQFLRDSGREEGITQGLAQGIAQGKAEGIQQEALRIAVAMLQNGIEPHLVTELTGLSPEALEKATH